MKELGEMVVEEIIHTINSKMGVLPDHNEIILEDGLSKKHIHFNYLVNIEVVPTDEKDIFGIFLSWYADLKPVIVAELVQLIDFIPEGIVIISDSFTYGKDGKMIFGEEAETIIAQDHFKMIEDEIRRQDFIKSNPDIRYDLKWYREPRTH